MLEILLFAVALVLLWNWGAELLRPLAWLALAAAVWSSVEGNWRAAVVAACACLAAWITGHVLHRWRYGHWRSVLLAAAFDDLAESDDDGSRPHGTRHDDVPKSDPTGTNTDRSRRRNQNATARRN